MQTENNAPEISYFRKTGKNAKRGQYHCAPPEEITALPPLTLPNILNMLWYITMQSFFNFQINL